MASISQAKLSITEVLPAGVSTVKVTCRLIFTQFELNMMNAGLQYRLNCKIWEEDLGQNNWFNADDRLFGFDTKRFPDANPNRIEDVTFEAKVRTSVLNNELGTDEIYGQLTLTNNFGSTPVVKKTRVIEHKF